MRSIFLSLVYFYILALGFQAPFILILGYIWVDIFTPQALSYNILSSIPASFLFAVSSILMYLTIPKDRDIKMQAASYATIFLGIWMTTTLLWAEVPDYAMEKWSWAIKSVLFSCFIPLFFRSRIQVESLIWTIVISGIAHCIPFAIKVLINGGGYGMQLGLLNVNHGYGESSTLSMFSISLIPMCLYLMKWQTLIPHSKSTRIMLGIFIFIAFTTSIGTYARTGLISIFILSTCMLKLSKNKILYLIIALVLGLLFLNFSNDIWATRMASIGDSNEGSAMGRVAAWLWTLKYVAVHPLGGSFDLYRINEFSLNLKNGETLSIQGMAFHSIYFEILGELGIPGFILFLAILLLTVKGYMRVINVKRDPNDQWLPDLSRFMLITLLIYLAGGAFIGIAFQSYFYYISALSVAMLNISSKTAHK